MLNLYNFNPFRMALEMVRKGKKVTPLEVERAMSRSTGASWGNPSHPEVIKKQEKYCKSHNQPMFMPKSGFCPSCHKDLTSSPQIQKAASKELITGCPFCRYSFVS